MPTKTRLRLALTAFVSLLALAGPALAPAPAATADVTTYTISGHVYLGDTSHPAGAADATVTLTAAGGAGAGSAPVAGDGSYVFTGLAYNSYTVTANYLGTGLYVSSAVSNPALAGATVDVTLPAAFTIAGHVSVDPASRPATAGEVRVTAESTVAANSVLTDSAGNYALKLQVGAPYSLRFEYQGAGNYPTWYSVGDAGPGTRTDPGATITLAANRPGVDVVIGIGAAIVGTLTDSAGIPVVGESVKAYVPDGAGGLSQNFVTTTDSNGHYYLRALPVGAYYLNFAESSSRFSLQTPGGGIFAAGDPIDVSDGLVHTADATLYAPGTISGTITGADYWNQVSIPLVIQLWFYDPVDGWRQVDQTAAGEQYSIGASYGGLPPGYYQLVLGTVGITFSALKVSLVQHVAEGQHVTWNTSVLGLWTDRGSATSFVAAAYHDVLDRVPSTRESDYWVGLLLNGYPRIGVAGGFNNSDEYRLIKIEEAYNQVLGRSSEASGSRYWLGMMRAGAIQPDDVYRIFLSSDEFYNNQGEGTRAGYIRALYLDQVGREPDTRGLNYWISVLNASGRGAVVDGLWYAQETYEARVIDAYSFLLGREPEGSGLAYWVGFARAYGLTGMRTTIMSTNEYWNLAQVYF